MEREGGERVKLRARRRGRGSVVTVFIILFLIPVTPESWSKIATGSRNTRFDSEADGIVTP